MNGIFTISLDFELHWGGFEKWPIESYRQYFLNTRQAIPEMLSLFEKYEVHVTWATVGMLFNQTRTELMANSPVIKPEYKVKSLSAYDFIETCGIGVDEEDDPFHFAPSLIKKIIGTPFQEVGSHTYAHYYCNEAGQTPEQFRADLKAAHKVAGSFGLTLNSLIFPRNQFNDQYLKVCFEEGITAVRSNPGDWFWKIESTQAESKWKRLNRGLDAYFPIGKRNIHRLSTIQVREGFPVCLPASRLLRPFEPKEYFLNDLKINRIKSEMKRAASQGEIYHLWWHPHNFGGYPQQNLDALENILKHYASCRDRWQMKSLTMGQTAALLRK